MPPVGGTYVEVTSATTSNVSTMAALKFHAVPSIPKIMDLVGPFKRVPLYSDILGYEGVIMLKYLVFHWIDCFQNTGRLTWNIVKKLKRDFSHQKFI